MPESEVRELYGYYDRFDPDVETVVVLHFCQADLTSRRGFVWPDRGPVACSDWSPEPSYGGGLHGWLWGAGELGAHPDGPPPADAKWLVVEVPAAEIVDIGAMVKYRRGVVLLCGEIADALQVIAARAPWPEVATMFERIAVGDYCVAGVGDHGVVSVGRRGTAVAGAFGTATAGDGGNAIVGAHGTATAGYAGTATADAFGKAIAGDFGCARVGLQGTATAGFHGTATTTSGGRAIVGDFGVAVAHRDGTAIAGDHGYAEAGSGGCVSAGIGGRLKLRHNLYGPSKGNDTTSASVGDPGIEPNTLYVLDAEDRFVRQVA